MKNNRTTLLLFALVYILIGSPLISQENNQGSKDDFNCFTILVGKSASNTGAVLLAHNEDDYGKQLVNWYLQPALQHHEGDEIFLKNGASLDQVEKTNKYLWLEMPGMEFSDSYLNEYGVCIASNSCPSREKKPQITNGGIGYRLRGIMAERASSAREAVEIAGRLIDEFGYTGSGRTYSIADQNEAWVLAVVNGKHWVAVRIPDDQIMILPNNYTITEINLDDSDNYLGSPDIVDYAVDNGWYNPDGGYPFNFRKAYASKGSIKHPGNSKRAWGAYHVLQYDVQLDDSFPFSFIPEQKVSKEDLMQTLGYHYEGTELDKSKNYTEGSPYKLNGTMICGRATVYGFVTELRSWLPASIGVVMWLAPQWPDIQPFIPYYCGISSIPEGFSKTGYNLEYPDFQNHYNPPEDIHVRTDNHYFWNCVDYSDYINEDYHKRIRKAVKFKRRFERKLFRQQKTTDKALVKMLAKSAEDAHEVMNTYTISLNSKVKTFITKSK
ncbi:MAG: C69 family dipeptidase [Bacteroidales bacterium]|nr:C69 family dipeptidase [Bacteroidales bacterium]